MTDDVLMNKAAVIERCVKRAREEYAAVGEHGRAPEVDALGLVVDRRDV